MNRLTVRASFLPASQLLPAFLLLVAMLLLAPITPLHAQETPTGCALSSWILQQPPHSTLTPELPPDQYDTSIMVNGVARTVHLQRGFAIGVFAQVPACRGLTVSPDGVLYATSYTGAIVALPDHRHLGRPDSVITLITGKSSVHGLGFLHDTLYFSNQYEFDQVTATNQDRTIKSIKTLISGFNTSDHITHTFVFDTVRQKIYMQLGSPCNYCITNDSTLATVMEYNYDGTGARIFARGLRNAVGLDLDPRTNALWVNTNGMDDLFGAGSGLHNSVPPECVYLLCDGANYGWPYAYGFRMRNPDAGYQIDTSYIEQLNGPVAEVLAHSAPLGLHFYRGAALPTRYKNAIFMAYHGSWDATPPAPPRVTVLWADSDGHNAKVQDFLTGFQLANGTRWGRTVEAIEGPDSALYISDDNAGVIYRVSYIQSSSAVSATAAMTDDLTLGGIRPNPFTRSTTLRYSLRSAMQTKIELVDVLGRTVRELLDGMIAQGDHEFRIDREGLPNGAYFLRVSAGSTVKSERLVVIN